MSLFKSKQLRADLNEVKKKGDNTAEELGVVKRRQLDIERRLKFMQQELQVQTRDFN